MLWKKSWEPEAVLTLLGAIVASFVLGNVATGLLARAAVPGFSTESSLGCVMLPTLSFHGMILVLGAVFLKFHHQGWREVRGETPWKGCLLLASAVLVVALPVMFALKALSANVLVRLGLPADEQTAVEMFRAATPLTRIYLGLFAIALAPVAEEFLFRGVLFSLAKRHGWPNLGRLGVSLLFALIHFNAPTFLPLFVLALALTWLYETTGALLAPMIAHSLFNTANLVLLLAAEKFQPPLS